MKHTLLTHLHLECTCNLITLNKTYQIGQILKIFQEESFDQAGKKLSVQCFTKYRFVMETFPYMSDHIYAPGVNGLSFILFLYLKNCLEHLINWMTESG